MSTELLCSPSPFAKAEDYPAPKGTTWQHYCGFPSGLTLLPNPPIGSSGCSSYSGPGYLIPQFPTSSHCHSPMGPQVDAANAQVVAGADVAWLQLQSPAIGSHGLFTPIPIGQGGTQLVPQKVILEEAAGSKQ